MKKIKFLIIGIVLIILISLIGLFNNKKIMKSSNDYVQGEKILKESNLISEIEEENNVELTADIQEKLEDSYTVQIDLSSNKCIKKLYDSTDSSNKNILLDWSNDEGILKSGNIELQKNRLYKLEIEMANGEIIEKDFELESAIIKLNTPQKNSDGTWSFPNFSVNNPCGDDLKYIVLQFASGIKSGDRLIATGIENASINTTNTLVSINVEGKTSQEIEEMIQNNFKVSLVDRSANEQISIKASINDEVIEKNLNYYAETGHYYEFVSAAGIAWNVAKETAESKNYMGMKGYLATITSEGEQQFAASLISGYGWLGGTCDYQYIYDKEGNRIYNSISESLWNWYWVTGPEAGTKFYDTTGTLTEYTNWASGEPNNSGSEYCLHMYNNCLWNDFNNNNSSISGYIVEYGGMPDDNFSLGETFSDVSVINTNYDGNI